MDIGDVVNELQLIRDILLSSHAIHSSTRLIFGEKHFGHPISLGEVYSKVFLMMTLGRYVEQRLGSEKSYK
ncbi:hypothetical protein RND71_023330 [Anisodus tanguticus]|uniref:Uncharacterized protein n=1 Tax=Anisodus tanguticus TaxID=243964 RepID=A0AAE1RU73_9SOLA|nr:hypothetical protein RND71_023330 [Anisodus tanguticus]